MHKLFKQQKKEMILTSERLSGIIHSGIFIQIFFSNRFFGYTELDQMPFLPYAIISLMLLLIFISLLAHRDFVKELHRNAITLYPKAFA